MTTRRSRLQIRPNIGRGAKEAGNDIPSKKPAVVMIKCPPRKEIKENTKLNTKLEGNDLSELTELMPDKTSAEHFANDKKSAPRETDNIKEHHNVITSNEMSSGTQKVLRESYTTLLNTNKECTVVLDRTVITKKHTEEIGRCSINKSSENSAVKSSISELPHEKEQKCEERKQLACSQQNEHETELKSTQSLHPSCSGADKEKNMIKSKENMLLEDDSTESAALEDCVVVKPVAHTSVVTLEKKSSNKASSGEEISKRRSRFSKKPPERGTMTMMDLIFWNPPNNPMSEEKKTDDNISEADASILQTVEEVEEEVDNTPNLKDEEHPSEEPSLQNETEELPGPRVMIGPNGDITIDEDSLVIRRTDPEKTASKEIVHDVAGCTYNSFRKARQKHYWSDSETAKFYKALSILGTDFSLMLSLFPTRNRQELKNKFKREERLHRHLVDRAIRDHQQFDLTAFDEDDDYENNDNDDEDYVLCSTNKKGGNNRKKCKRKKRVKDKGSFEDSISDDDVSVVEPISKSNESIGVRKSTRKRKETSKEIPIYTSTPAGKRRQAKPRVPKPKKKAEDVPVEREYESVEIVEVPNENLEVEVPNESLEVVSVDQSVIVCHSPLASDVVAYEDAHSSNVHVSITETVHDVEMVDTSIELKQNEKQDTNNIKQLNMPLHQLNNAIPTSSNNLLEPANSSQSHLTPGQLVLVAGKSNNTNEQIVHVYVVSPPPSQQNMQCTVRTPIHHKTKDNSSS